MAIALELEQLKKTYPGGVQALRGIDLKVEAGDFYALLGPNGAGKSTTIGIISSLVNKSSGRVSVFGYDLEKDVVNAKRQLGLVPQEFNFNPFETVQQIVVNQAGYYGVERKEAIARSEKYLKQLDLWEKRNERARMLSGGMDGNDVNIESLIALNPDIVFYNAGSKAEQQKLENAGLTAVGVSPTKWNYDCIKTYNEWMSLLDKIYPSHASDRENLVNQYSNDKYNEIQSKVANVTTKQKVLFLFQYDSKTMITSSKSFFGQWWCDAVGAENVAHVPMTNYGITIAYLNGILKEISLPEGE